MKVAEVKISYSHKVPASKQMQVTGSRTAEQIFRENWENLGYTETFKVMLLSRANKVLGIAEI